MRIILASGSPRRRQLLAQVGLEFDVVVSDADETIEGHPHDQVAALARRKAEATRDLLLSRGSGYGGDAVTGGNAVASGGAAIGGSLVADTLIVAADTLVAVENGGVHSVLGKPADAHEAYAMLSALQGRKHTVYTGVAILRTQSVDGQVGLHPCDETLSSFVESTDVYFRTLSDAAIRAYIATGEPFDKAGAYGIQEKGALLVERVEGDFYTVMGLPIARLCVALEKMGVAVWGA
ncbi:MAG: Maf family protein [Defluviitaleaceae bacterium]|nr:Maf family protein [Defluviitaleaceae bacterium]